MDAIVAELDEIPPVMLEAIGSTSALGPERMRYLGETIGDPWRPLPTIHYCTTVCGGG